MKKTLLLFLFISSAAFSQVRTDSIRKIDSLAKQLEEEQISEESVKLAEDAAAVAAIWSFGLSMAAFAALAVTDAALKAAIKEKGVFEVL